MCNKSCAKTSCPFAYTEESEKIQNYGCLPTPIEIIAMRVFHGKTWACHSDHSKPCIGALKNIKEKGFDNSIIDKNFINDSNVEKEHISFTEEQYQQIQDSHMAKLAEKYT